MNVSRHELPYPNAPKTPEKGFFKRIFESPRTRTLTAFLACVAINAHGQPNWTSSDAKVAIPLVPMLATGPPAAVLNSFILFGRLDEKLACETLGQKDSSISIGVPFVESLQLDLVKTESIKEIFGDSTPIVGENPLVGLNCADSIDIHEEERQ